MASLKWWDDVAKQWVTIAAADGDYVRRAGDLMTGPLILQDDGSNPVLLNVVGQAEISALAVNSAEAASLLAEALTIPTGAQPGYVWTATDDQGHGMWIPLASMPVTPSVIVSDTEPLNPAIGTQWWDTSRPDVEPFTVSVGFRSTASVFTPTTTAWTTSTPWPTWTVDVPCDGVFEVDHACQMSNTTANGVTATRVSVRSASGATVTQKDPVNQGQARLTGATGTGRSKMWGKDFYVVSGVPDGGGTVEFGFDAYNSTASTSTFLGPEAHMKFTPYGASRVVFLDLSE